MLCELKIAAQGKHIWFTRLAGDPVLKVGDLKGPPKASLPGVTASWSSWLVCPLTYWAEDSKDCGIKSLPSLPHTEVASWFSADVSPLNPLSQHSTNVSDVGHLAQRLEKMLSLCFLEGGTRCVGISVQLPGLACRKQAAQGLSLQRVSFILTWSFKNYF